MPTLPRILVVRGRVFVRGRLDEARRREAVAVLLRIGSRRLSATVSPEGEYVFAFHSRRRFLWATVWSADAFGLVRLLSRVLIWKRRGAALPKSVLSESDRALLRGVFDASHYLASLPERMRGRAQADPLAHYLAEGTRRRSASPHPWFAPRWYRARNPEVDDEGIEPLLHYVKEGWLRERHPHPGFDQTRYLARHPELLTERLCPLAHWNLRRDASEVFAPRCAAGSEGGGASDFSHARPYPHVQPARSLATRDAYLSRWKPGNRVALFTVIVGDYDCLRLPEHLSADVDYHLFTDRSLSGYGVFRVSPPPWKDAAAEPTKLARRLKLSPHRLLDGYDVVLFMDANVLVRGDLAPWIDRFVSSGKPLAFLPHPARDCLYEEAIALAAAGRAKAEDFVPQLLRYRGEGYPFNAGLIESNLYACRPSMESARAFFELWWAELRAGSARDQFSANYVLRRLGLEDYHPLLGPGGNTRNHPDVALLAHGTHDRGAFAHLA